MNRIYRWGSAALVLAPMLGCGGEAPGASAAGGELGVLSVTGAYAMVAPPGPTGSAYFTITNRGDTPDTVLGVSVGGVQASMHEVRRDGDLARMAPILPRAIPAGDSLVLRPGGIHVMYSTARPAAPGDSLELVLRFALAGPLRMPVPVRPFGVE